MNHKKSKVFCLRSKVTATAMRGSLVFGVWCLVFVTASATSVYFPVSEMTGATNDVTINVKAVNNPIIYNGSFYYLPKQGTNLTTTGGYVTNSFVPGRYTVTVSGLQKSWNMYVTNSASVVNAVDLSSAITIYSGIMGLTGRSIEVTNDGLGNYTITDTNTSGGGGTNYGNDTGLPGVVNGSNIGTNLATLATDAELLAATNSIYTAANTYSDAAKLAATNKLNTDITAAFVAADTVVSNGLSGRLSDTNTALLSRIGLALTNGDTRAITFTNFENFVDYTVFPIVKLVRGTDGFQILDYNNVGWNGTASTLYTAGGIIAGYGFQGDGSGVTNFNGANIASGTIAPARLGSGSSITTKFLRGDSTWQTLGAGSGDMLAANNLSDVASTNAARTNIAAHNASNLTEGTIPDARMPALTGDVTTSAGAVATTIAANAVALGTDTTGNYVATIADSGASEVTVSGSGSETAAVTLAIASGITRDTEIDTIAEVEAIWGRKVTTNNATLPATSLMIGDGTRGVAPTTTGSGVLTALGNTANGASGFLLYDAELAALGGLTSAADKIPYFTGSGTAGLVTIGTGLSFSGGTLSATSATQYFYTNSVAAGSISNNFDVKIDGDLEVTGSTSFSNLYATNFFIPGQSNGIAAIQSDGSVKATNTPVVTSVDLGLATDTTLTRSSAGNLAVEGNVVYRAGGTDVPVADGGTGLSSGTSGGVLGFTASGTIASSAALAANALVIGGGAGATPTTTTTASGALTFFGTPSSANFASLLTDESGTAGVVPFFNLTSLTAGDGVKWSGSAWTNGVISGSGTVTSVGLTGPTGFTVSGSPVTGSGTITLSLPGLVHTNGMSVAAQFSNNVALSASAYLYPSNLTASRLLTFTAAGGVTNLGVSSASPVNADGTLSTFAQINALAPNSGAQSIVTNGYTPALYLAGNVIGYSSVEIDGTLFAATNSAVVGAATINSTNKFQVVAAGGTLNVGTNGTTYGTFSGDGSGLTSVPGTTGVVRDWEIPMGTWWTNGTANPATLGTWTNSAGDAWLFTDAVTNDLRVRFALPGAWNAGTVQFQFTMGCTLTNTGTTQVSTNVVFGIKAASVGSGQDEGNLTFGTEINFTNRLSKTNWWSTQNTTPAITVGNTPAARKDIIFALRRITGDTGDATTNAVSVIHSRIIFTETTTEPSTPAATN